MKTDDTPDEDRQLFKEQLEQRSSCKHEWEYLGAGFKRGDPTISIVDFFCKWCTTIKTIRRNQSELNLNYDDEMTDYRDK